MTIPHNGPWRLQSCAVALTTLWVGCWTAGGASTDCGSGEIPCDVLAACPSFARVPCHSNRELSGRFWYCDDCGLVWACSGVQYDESTPQTFFQFTDYPCECVTADYQFDTSSRTCTDTAD